ncbi:flagellar hook-associated protein FlgK [Ferrimonas marina]|uniref:Flagellar hook-associated protein 1 n=1 Tax=Ferrimonas marina TaxID=299255 RepID=A0A1M5YAZ0_9GAMM|nr:flagellar hook-associated protein FlgK [Ferrimonas marina]SHI09152.1 flagellar hook-associated protein 1 FlgK [Ferrimonas marina]
MADMMSIARSGILAAQQRLGVTSNNIANVGTDGYNRQVVEQQTQQSQLLGGHFVGTGTYVADIKRVYNEYAQRELVLANSELSQAETQYTKLSELDQVFSVVGQSIPNSLNNLFENVNNLADMPTDLAVRENMLTSAGQLASAYVSFSSELRNQLVLQNDQIDGVVSRVNAITEELANINEQLQKLQGNDLQLLDQQDRLITELSEFVQVNIIPQENGVKSLMAGGSVMLVAGENAMQLGTTAGDPDPLQTRLTGTIGSQTVILSNNDLGGQLQGLFDYREGELAMATARTDMMALGMADAFNTAQGNGFDLNGDVGQNLFTDINDPVLVDGRAMRFEGNSGTMQLDVMIDDTLPLTGDTYTLSFDGANYSMVDGEGGSVALTVDPNDANRLISPDGFSIHLSTTGVAQAGDKWQITPTKGAASKMATQITEPRELAAAGYGLETLSGSGEASLKSVDRANPGFPAIGEVLTVTADPTAGTFNITDSSGTTVASGAITGNQISALGFVLELDDATASGDQFSLDLSFGPGDNNNAVAMAGLASAKLMESGDMTLTDVYQEITTTVGGRARAAETAVASATAVQAQAQSRVEAESGVNLDEEAADLMRFQQAYQASARIMTVAKETFDTLFNSVR